MLSSAFFISVFSSIVWIFYALSNLSGGKIEHFALLVAVVVLPILVLWSIFGYLYQYLSTSVLNKNMYSLFKQMKKNQEYADVIVKLLFEERESIKDSTVLNKFDIFISDMNELLAEIIERGGVASPEQIDNLWVKVKNGGKWALGKVLIDVNQKQPNLSKLLLEKSFQDVVLGGTILEFCSRYQGLISTLEKHDQERIFLNVIETGVFGKVFSLLAQPADSIRQNRDLTLVHRQMTEEGAEKYAFEDKNDIREEGQMHSKKEEKKTLTEDAKRLFLNTFTRKKTEKDTESSNVSDPLSVAFAKSFGRQEEKDQASQFVNADVVEQKDEKSIIEESKPILDALEDVSVLDTESEVLEKYEQDSGQMPEIIIKENDSQNSYTSPPSIITPELENGFKDTRNHLSNLKKEWEEAKQRDLSASHEAVIDENGMPEPKINKDEDFSYPFGGWTNAENYHN